MADSDTEVPEVELSPAEAFSIVANDARIDILEALAQSERRSRARSTLSFSELFERVELDDTGLFNYHLDQLTGHFVQKVEAGYRLRYAGRKVVRTIVEGAFTERITVEPFEVEGECFACGSAIQGFYRDEQVGIECTNCKEVGMYAPLPPHGVKGRSPEEIMETVNRDVRSQFTLARSGICPECRGRMTVEITSESPAHWTYEGHEFLAEYRCEHCENQFWTYVGIGFANHPAVVSFYHDHAIDVTAKPFWTLDFCTSNRDVEVLSRDPWTVRIHIVVEDDELALTVDENLDLLEAERRTSVV